MKSDLVGRLWVRLFGPRATSVSPQISEDAIIDRMVERGLIEPAWTRELTPIPPGTPYVDPRQRGAEPEPVGSTILKLRDGETPTDAVKRHLAAGGKVEDIPGWHDQHIAGPARPGIKPPPDPPVDKEWCWSEWQRERDALSPPGWTYCRFPIQYPDDKAVFVFGLVRGHFGIYHTPFMIRDTDTGADNQEILAGLTLMKNGAGIGLFTCRHVAAQAAELAEKVETRWDEIDPDHQPTWRNVVERIHAAWTGAGILPAVNAYAYQARGETRWCVYGTTAETIMQGRPEKLS